jgi:hypothetical protein
VRLRSLSLLTLSLVAAVPVWAQSSSTTLAQTVDQRGTITELAGSPLTGLTVGSNITFSSILDTSGVSPLASENIVLQDGGTTLTTLPITVVSTTNLVPYSEDFTKWTTVAIGAAAPTLSLTANAPDGTTNAATVFAFPDTTGAAVSGLTYAIPGTSYAGQNVTASVWLNAAASGIVSLQITDSPQTVAIDTKQCTVTVGWTRCSVTYAMPASSGPGLSISILSTNTPAQSIAAWGAQIEQAPVASPYIQTTGTSVTANGGAVTYSTAALAAGSHSITASYAGDANFIASGSNPLTFSIGQGTVAVALTADSPSSAYGTATTFTATLTGPGAIPTGTVTFMDGATTLGTGTITADVATFQTSTLLGGAHSVTAVYSGDSQYNSLTSSVLAHTVTVVPVTITVTSTKNPSIYGDAITFTMSAAGIGVTPTGTMTIMDGATALGTPTLDGTGKATISTNALTAGAHNLTVTYSGDNNYR